METDYIKKADVAEEIKIICQNCRDMCAELDGLDPDCESGCGIFELKGKVAAIPAADVRPVVRGTWEPGETIFFCGVEHTAPRTCSVCGRSALDEPWYFCPSCGADMRL